MKEKEKEKEKELVSTLRITQGWYLLVTGVRNDILLYICL